VHVVTCPAPAGSSRRAAGRPRRRPGAGGRRCAARSSARSGEPAELVDEALERAFVHRSAVQSSALLSRGALSERGSPPPARRGGEPAPELPVGQDAAPSPVESRLRAEHHARQQDDRERGPVREAARSSAGRDPTRDRATRSAFVVRPITAAARSAAPRPGLLGSPRKPTSNVWSLNPAVRAGTSIVGQAIVVPRRRCCPQRSTGPPRSPTPERCVRPYRGAVHPPHSQPGRRAAP
jgi:hypothetical protein